MIHHIPHHFQYRQCVNHLRAGESEMSNRCVDVESFVDVFGCGNCCVLGVGTLVALAVDDGVGCMTCDVVTSGCIPYGSVARARESS